jgi:UDPglucose--hexose-1-phosphate uridylyltransferase
VGEGPLPEARIDQLTGQRALLAPGRRGRPRAFVPAAAQPRADAGATCPFCEGREQRTPPEVWANRPDGGEADGPGWTQRSVPNRYPVLTGPGTGVDAGSAARDSGLTSAADPLRSSARAAEPELFRTAAVDGAHEVIVNSPRHVASLADLDEGELAGALAAWRTRIATHADDASLVHLCVNEGPLAGSTLPHTHAQLFALPFVPTEVARERERFTAYHERTMGSHLLEDVLVEEVRRRDRLVAIDGDAALFCPWASRTPYEMRIVPRSVAPRFERDDRGAAMLGRALAALGRLFDGVPQLNLWVRTAPRGTAEFHWHIDLLPRLSIRAGFELGTGIEINSVAPERAAAELREALDA